MTFILDAPLLWVMNPMFIPKAHLQDPTNELSSIWTKYPNNVITGACHEQLLE